MSGKTVYLISGANCGIGHGLSALLAARPNTIIFASARNPAAQSLKDLSANDQANNEAVASKIQSTAGQLDFVIANAAPSIRASIPASESYSETGACGIPLVKAAVLPNSVATHPGLMASEMSNGCLVSRTLTRKLITALEDLYALAERWMYLAMEARPVKMTAKMGAPDGEASRRV
ncbi:hypothetical protein DFH08DRAFT_825822 [Mycena albidolilacea]|uniref:Uncharacterized protein n=1 Tax=Mycena albidolilacea TaxID=1033008 RepID=A0AAD7E9T2_9AGAR|nr:hypothetical protein DFH08DRAFT_825822 [Mycena albidolilacea]